MKVQSLNLAYHVTKINFWLLQLNILAEWELGLDSLFYIWSIQQVCKLRNHFLMMAGSVALLSPNSFNIFGSLIPNPASHKFILLFGFPLDFWENIPLKNPCISCLDNSQERKYFLFNLFKRSSAWIFIIKQCSPPFSLRTLSTKMSVSDSTFNQILPLKFQSIFILSNNVITITVTCLIDSISKHQPVFSLRNFSAEIFVIFREAMGEIMLHMWYHALFSFPTDWAC